MNSVGTMMKKTMPRYGLVWSPNMSSRNTTRNTRALIVTMKAPATEMGLRTEPRATSAIEYLPLTNESWRRR